MTAPPPRSSDDLLEEVLELEGDGMKAALDERCRSYPNLAAELRRRLEHLQTHGLLGEKSASEMPRPGSEVGGYRILRQLGEGGMGIVFLAQDLSLDRQVALKLVRPDRVLQRRAVERLLREARAAARVDHPALCTVYDVGRHGDAPFLAMRFVDGTSLETCIEQARRGRARGQTAGLSLPLPSAGSGSETEECAPRAIARPHPARSVQAVATLARGLHAAHEAGVVHRDVKPGNVFLDREGRPVLLDFGLAKHVLDDSTLTRPGSPIGTPAYMAPEQVRGDSGVDRRVDVYGLGAVLYECLTLQPPHVAAERESLYRAILNDPPADPRRFDRRIPRDLAVVALKALEKEPRRRYATASDFADDLERVVRGAPIAARPPGPLRRASQWARRHPLVANASLLCGLGVLALAALLERSSRALAVERRLRLVRDSTVLQDKQPVVAALLAREAWMLGREDVEARSRLFESLAQLCQFAQWDGSKVRQCALSPDGSLLAELREKEGLLVRELEGGAERWARTTPEQLWFVAWAPDGKQLATIGLDVDNEQWVFRRFDVATGHIGEPIGRGGDLEEPFDAFRGVPLLAFVGGRRPAIVVGDAAGRMFSFDDHGRELGHWQAHDGSVHGVLAIPGGDRVLSYGADGRARVWSLPDRTSVDFPPAEHALCTACVAPDGRLVAVGTALGHVAVCDLDTGEKHELEGFTRKVTCLAFSHDGSLLVGASQDLGVKLWEARSGMLLRRLEGMVDVAIWSATWLEDGRLALAGRQGAIRVFEPSGIPFVALHGCAQFVSTLQAGPRPGELISGSWDGSVRRWRVDSPEFPRSRAPAVVLAARWAPDGSRIAVASTDGSVGTWNPQTGASRRLKLPPVNFAYSVEWLDVDDLFVVGSTGAKDTATWVAGVDPGDDAEVEVVWSRTLPDKRAWGSETLKDGRRVLVYGEGLLQLWERSGEVLKFQVGNEYNAYAATTSADGRLVAAVDTSWQGRGAQLSVWDSATARVLFGPKPLASPSWGMAYDPRGVGLLVGHDDGSVVLLDDQGNETQRYPGPRSLVRRVAFSPDGRYVLAGDNDGTVWIWERDGRLLAQCSHPGIVWSVGFAPEGDRFLSAGSNREVRVWPLPTDETLERLAARIFRELTTEERAEFGIR